MARSEWSILALWGIAIAATALIAGEQGTLVLGSVFFVCMIGSLIAIYRAEAHHVEWIMALLWLVATAAMVVVTAKTALSNVLGPLYFVCMLGSIFVARRVHLSPRV